LHFLAVLSPPFTLLFMRHDMPANLEAGAHQRPVNATRRRAAGGQEQRAIAVLQRQFRIGCCRRRGRRFFMADPELI